MDIRTKRAYVPAAPSDGMRVLVDRLWPRGITKERASLALWMKEIAPSTLLRAEFHHDAAQFPAFVRRYHAELEANPQAVADLRALAAKGRVTLVYGARDEVHNNATALLDYLLPRRG